MIRKGDLQCGDIVWTEFDPSQGHEFQKKRPALVIESDVQLSVTNVVTVVPLTSNVANTVLADDIVITANAVNKLMSDSIAKMHYITSFDYVRFDKIIGRVDSVTLAQVETYLRRHFSL